MRIACRVEVETPKKLTDANSSANTEGTPLLDDETGTARDEPRAKVRMWTLLPEISREDQAVMMSLWCLFGVDSFASGLIPLAWVIPCMVRRSRRTAGVTFLQDKYYCCGVHDRGFLARQTLQECSFFTHLPSAVTLALTPIPGPLVDDGVFWVALVAAGSLKECYDLGLLVVFQSYDREKAERERVAGDRSATSGDDV
ncbi:uncharacterized protein CC84DRAFT_1207057 [Paraphaeosphaeria sporulosa]|uniref:Uncharacterized protein n=1 Tax=Paraphaeosphaeria sporulosa TaxID=1460663 RepID=A0A177CAC8_9PLEO|nr:uncharacterized protein CC84DRAFT_1207057 [Paraphaeosphaeria sporulosa]OAG03779.1 hypothetical protein CC84DRAFT_1207057 [Paraphaeosphaeria sporulosa]